MSIKGVDRSAPAVPTSQPVERRAEEVVQPEVPLARPSRRNLDNLRGASNGSFAALPAVQRRGAQAATGPDAAARAAAVGVNPPRTEAVRQVEAAREAYGAARTEVNRLNASLEQALRTPALQSPEAAERFRAAYLETHQAAYAREGETAAALAQRIRDAEPHLRADGELAGTQSVAALNDRMAVSRALDTLAQSSQFATAVELAGRLQSGPGAPLPPDVAGRIAERAGLTSLRQDLAHGHSLMDSLTRASSLVGTAGFVAQRASISALGNALATRENANEFIRTGDMARFAAAGASAVGTGAAAWTAAVGGGPLVATIGMAAFAGKSFFEASARRNEYLGHVNPAYERAFGVTQRDVNRIESAAREQAMTEVSNETPGVRGQRRPGQVADMVQANQARIDARIRELASAALAALRGSQAP